ncbi:hypothetical protein [Deinococcus apachensis]|uniref:hypothetical protein n=1 Tax=Deinococcus apachensis TaxID=309886 RepID=UPI00058B3FD8|nr:hypothetical protein [Deinococcus apachensis]
MTLNAHPQVTARPDAAPTPPEVEDRMLTPQALWKRYGLPRDLIYTAIHAGELPAYNAARQGKPRFLIAVSDFLTWRETLRVGAKK